MPGAVVRHLDSQNFSIIFVLFPKHNQCHPIILVAPQTPEGSRADRYVLQSIAWCFYHDAGYLPLPESDGYGFTAGAGTFLAGLGERGKRSQSFFRRCFW